MLPELDFHSGEKRIGRSASGTADLPDMREPLHYRDDEVEPSKYRI